MPLPIKDQAWPPAGLAEVQAKHAEWSAWYSGDREALSNVYGGQTTGDTTGFFSSERGGWRAAVGAKLEHWFWGTRSQSAEPRKKLHVPLASDIAVTGASLLFSEPPKFLCKKVATAKRLVELAEQTGMHSTFLEASELACALGGVYLRVCWDKKSRPEGPWLSPVHADAAIPEWRWGRLSAVTFWRVVEDDGEKVVRYLEKHEIGRIYHGLYQGTVEALGHAIPLTENAATEFLADVVDEESSVPTGIPYLTASYVPNMKPNRIWRENSSAAHLGRASIQGVEPMLDGLDSVYSSWERDIRLARARLIIPQSYLQDLGPGKGASFDADRELYETLNSLDDGKTGMNIHPQQFAIRVQEHADSAANWMEQVVRGAGYSMQTFGEKGDVAATATEVRARNERSFTTRGRQIGYWNQGGPDALVALLAIDSKIFGAKVEVERPRLEWPDGVATDPKALAETLALLNQAAAASTKVKVQLLHPDWEESEVDEEVERILKETGALVEDPSNFNGDNSDVPDEELNEDPEADEAEQDDSE